MRLALALFAVLLAGFVVACGGGETKRAPSDPVQDVPTENGIRRAVETAAAPKPTDFPPSRGRTLEDLASQMAAGPSLALASSVFTTGAPTRMAFGMIAKDGTPVYGPTAVYVAPTPERPGRGTVRRARRRAADRRALPLQAGRADLRIRSSPSTAPTWSSPGTAPTPCSPATRKPDGGFTGATGNVDGLQRERRPDPRGRREGADRAHGHAGDGQGRRVARSTRACRRATCTPSTSPRWWARSRSRCCSPRPQLCASRVCGPVTDIELQMESKYRDRMTFIHQEVYVDNDTAKGLREPLRRFNLPSEPWLFVVDRRGHDHRPARGLDRRPRVRGRGQVRAVRRAFAAFAAALAAGAFCSRRPPRRTGSRNAGSCRSRSGCSPGPRPRCS